MKFWPSKSVSWRSAATARPMAAAGLLFGLATGVTFARVLAGRCLYFGDFQAAFEPLRGIVGRSWREGLPMWSSALSNGMPLLASPFAGALYPPNLVFALSTSHTARVLSVLVVLHVLFGGWGAALLARRLGQSAAGAAAAGLAFALTGATVSGTHMVVLVCTAMWLPWLLLAVFGAWENRTYAGLALGAALGMMLLAGDPFMILAGLLGGAFLLVGSKPPSRMGKALFVGLALGVLLAAPSLLALRQYYPATIRAGGLAASERLSESLHPLEAIGFFIPNAFGSRVLGGPDGFLYPGQADGNGFPFFPGLYTGVCALALAGVGASRAHLRMRLLAWFLVLGLLALGRYGPLAFASGFPGLAALRYPSKWILAATLPLALLVGGGVSTIGGGVATKDRRLLAGFLACGLIAMAAIAAGANLGFARLLARASTPLGGEKTLLETTASIRSHLLEGAAWGAVPALIALGIVRFAEGASRASWLVSVLLALDLIFENRSLAPTAPERFFESTPAAVRVIQGDPMGHERVWVNQTAAARAIPSRTPADPGLLDTALARRRERLDAYAAASYGLRLAFHVDLERLATARYSLLTGLLYSAPQRAQITLLGAAGVSHLVSPIPFVDDRLVEIASLDVGADQPLHVYRSRALLPRARLVKFLVPARTDQYSALFARLEDGFFGGGTIVEERDLPAITEACRTCRFNASGGDVQIIEDAGSRVVLRTSGGGGFLVLTDCFAPGWRARIDGRPATIFPADVAFRMIVVPPGTRDVVFDYNPWRT